MCIVQVSSHRGHAKPGVVLLRDRWQRIDVTRELRLAIKGLIGRSRTTRAGAVVETPNRLERQTRRKAGCELPLVELVKRAGNPREPGGIDEWRREGRGRAFCLGGGWMFARCRTQR